MFGVLGLGFGVMGPGSCRIYVFLELRVRHLAILHPKQGLSRAGSGAPHEQEG